MDKEKSPSPSLPPQPPLPSSSSSSGRHSPLPSPQPPSGGGRFSHDLSRMPDFPPRSAGHRRAHSEILALPDDITFDSDLGVVGGGAGGTAEGSDEADDEDIFSYLNIDKFAGSSSFSAAQMGGDGVFEESGAGVDVGAQHYTASSGMGGSWAGPSVERPRIRHQHSMSMDGSTSIKSELLTSGGEGASSAEAKKAMSAAKLAELAAVDPKRAKRIWANRQSAARSKERKMRYIAELERKVQTLQTEATTLSAQLTMLQRDTTGLNAENSELKLRVQSMEQQVHIQDALNDALREEVQRLKLVTGQVIPNGGQMMGYGSGSFGTAASQPFYPQNHAMQSILAAQQFQQLHIHSQQLQSNQLQHQHQQQLPPSMELKSRAPVTISSPNQNHRDSSSDPNNLLPKD